MATLNVEWNNQFFFLSSWIKNKLYKGVTLEMSALETPYGGQFLFINLVDITKLFCNTSTVT